MFGIKREREAIESKVLKTTFESIGIILNISREMHKVESSL